MDGNRTYDEIEQFTGEGNGTSNLLSVEQLQRLIHLLDRSEVSELELKRAEEGMRLVLRKSKAPESNVQKGDGMLNAQHPDSPAGAQYIAPSSIAPPVETKHSIAAHFVGIFHAAAKPKRRPLVAPGDHVKAGQLVATIESLNVFNEVESPVAGQVVEILVQDGQPVEYGQHLMNIDSAVGEA